MSHTLSKTRPESENTKMRIRATLTMDLQVFEDESWPHFDKTHSRKVTEFQDVFLPRFW